MAKKREVERLISYAGEHEGSWLFYCPSFTDPDTEYEIVFNREKMVVTCGCMDSSCREHRRWRVLDPKSDCCKHIRILREHVLPMLQRAGVI